MLSASHLAQEVARHSLSYLRMLCSVQIRSYAQCQPFGAGSREAHLLDQLFLPLGNLGALVLEPRQGSDAIQADQLHVAPFELHWQVLQHLCQLHTCTVPVSDQGQLNTMQANSCSEGGVCIQITNSSWYLALAHTQARAS